MHALEVAMDELSFALGMDPLALRLKNYSERDEAADLPYSSKALRSCYEQTTARFGWSARQPQPRSMRAGHELVAGAWPVAFGTSSSRLPAPMPCCTPMADWWSAAPLPNLLKQHNATRCTHSAVFCEVKVDEDFGTVRVTRVVSAVAAGRIINPQAARSQVIGGIV